jgi:hypothetical protein
LLEVVISVATLSLISIFILQMFLSSSNLNGRARNADNALAVAITEIDRIKSGNEVSVGTSVIYYDKKWQALAAVGGNARFFMGVSVTGASGLYAIETKVWEMKTGEPDYLLASLDAKKYIPIDAGAIPAEVKAKYAE